ncbi:zinc-dependent alcohol dehydrogenase [Nocardioides sp.]|uniref:zinc-dependent alcohol dehydrogenase n=1 Tax=Nocardioides sp. TaxID=35761 RepID=UPI003D149CDD
MLAVRFDTEGASVLDSPPPSGDGVLVNVKGVGICGSDLSMLASGGAPLVPGHEIAGVTEDGVAVAVQPNLPCGACALCAAGRSHLCPESMQHFLGVNGLDGGFAEQVLVHPRQLRPVPAGLAVELAALAEPVAVAAHAATRLKAANGAPVLVVGAGTIGLFAAAILTQLGHQVSVVARHSHQQVLAEAAGAHVVTSTESATRSFDSILDTAGSQSAMDLAYEASAPGGRIVSVGCGGWSVTTSVTSLVKELSLVASVIYTEEEFEDAVLWLTANSDFSAQLVTHRFSLADAPEAFRLAAGRADSGSVKVLIQP